MNGFDLRLQMSRRVVVAAHYGSLVSAFAFYAVIARLHNYGYVTGWTLLSLGGIYLISGILLVTVSWPYGIGGGHWTAVVRVDERQRQVRQNALAYSYWLTSIMILLAFFWVTAADFTWGPHHPGAHLWRPMTMHEWWRAFWVGVMVNSMFPAALIAWNEPDMPTDTATAGQVPAKPAVARSS